MQRRARSIGNVVERPLSFPLLARLKKLIRLLEKLSRLLRLVLSLANHTRKIRLSIIAGPLVLPDQFEVPFVGDQQVSIGRYYVPLDVLQRNIELWTGKADSGKLVSVERIDQPNLSRSIIDAGKDVKLPNIVGILLPNRMDAFSIDKDAEEFAPCGELHAEAASLDHLHGQIHRRQLIACRRQDRRQLARGYSQF